MRAFQWALALLLLATIGHATDAPLLPTYPEVRPGVTLSFPRDHGAMTAGFVQTVVPAT